MINSSINATLTQSLLPSLERDNIEWNYGISLINTFQRFLSPQNNKDERLL